MAYNGCFGYGMMSGGYGYGWMLFSWFIGLLVVVGLVLFIIWMTKKIQESDRGENKHKENNRRLK